MKDHWTIEPLQICRSGATKVPRVPDYWTFTDRKGCFHPHGLMELWSPGASPDGVSIHPELPIFLVKHESKLKANSIQPRENLESFLQIMFIIILVYITEQFLILKIFRSRSTETLSLLWPTQRIPLQESRGFKPTSAAVVTLMYGGY